MYHLSRGIKEVCPDLSPPVHCLLPVEIMPGHDHSLKGLFEPESLNSETMLLTWICPSEAGRNMPCRGTRDAFSLNIRNYCGSKGLNVNT